MNHSKTTGFTIIEVLVVIVLIAIVATIAVPNFSGTKTKARQATILADIRNIATTLELQNTSGSYPQDGEVLPTQIPLSSNNVLASYVSDAYNNRGFVLTIADAADATRLCMLYFGDVSAGPLPFLEESTDIGSINIILEHGKPSCTF